MEHSNVYPDDSHTNPQLRDGFYRLDHPDSDLFLSDALQRTYMDRMDDHGKLMREIADKPDQPNVASKPAEPCKSDCHTCTRHPERSCNCARGECGDDSDEWIREYTTRAIDYYDRIDDERNKRYIGQQFPILRTPEPNAYGGFECPVNGKACHGSVCDGTCQESRDRAKAGTNWCATQAADDNRNTAIQTGDA